MKRRSTGTLVLLAFILNIGSLAAQSDYDNIFKVADYIIDNTSFKIIDTETKKLFDNTRDLELSEKYRIESPYNEWDYTNGVLAMGMIRLSETTGKEKYKLYSLKNYDFIFSNLEYFSRLDQKGAQWPSLFQYFHMSELDACGAMSAGLCDVYRYSPDKNYKAYLDRAVSYITNDQIRLEDATLARNDPRKMTLWADDLFMSVPFLARMAKLTGKQQYMDDAILQVINFNKHLYNENNGLYFHCWYSDNHRNGVAHWGRCNGWIIMAEVELLRLLPDGHPEKQKLINILLDHLIGISRFQDQSGLWHQIVDKPDSYPETSATAMFVYGIASAVNEGWINGSYAKIAQDGWKGLSEKITNDGQMEDVCIGTGITDNLRYYYERPTELNDIHGIGAFLMAGSEMIKLSQQIQKK